MFGFVLILSTNLKFFKNMIGLLIGIAALAFLIERLWPAGSLPKVKGWWARVALVNICQLGVVILAGLTWDQWFSRASVFSFLYFGYLFVHVYVLLLFVVLLCLVCFLV